jgi:hypothetical protein
MKAEKVVVVRGQSSLDLKLFTMCLSFFVSLDHTGGVAALETSGLSREKDSQTQIG